MRILHRSSRIWLTLVDSFYFDQLHRSLNLPSWTCPCTFFFITPTWIWYRVLAVREKKRKKIRLEEWRRAALTMQYSKKKIYIREKNWQMNLTEQIEIRKKRNNIWKNKKIKMKNIKMGKNRENIWIKIPREKKMANETETGTI